MKYKNYYKILDLSGPKVTDDEIKSAYRKLTKKFHPDINPGDKVAEEKFKNINEAYEVLGNKEKKRRYNIRYYMHIMQNGVNLEGLKRSVNSASNSEFVKIFVGDSFNKQNSENNVKKENLNVDIPVTLTLDEAFNGVTKKIVLKPHGEKEKTITVRIPRGVTSGTSIKLVGEGKTSKNSSVKGDMYVKIDVLESPKYKLLNNNLEKEVKISYFDAVLGAQIPVESIDATYKLNVPAGTQIGELLTIKEAGFISRNGLRGDLIAKITVDVPKHVSKEELELYEAIKNLKK